MKQDALDTAVRAARLAGRVILRNLGKLSAEDVHLKKAADFATRVDYESEKVIIAEIRTHFPDHQILAEESLPQTSTTYYRWIIDPLDGTTNYVHEFPFFSVSIALEYGGETIMGVIFDPLRDELFAAEKGRGAFLNNRRIAVSGLRDIGYGLITTGFPFRRKDIIDKYLEVFRNVFIEVGDLRRAGSAALDLAYLACGRCDGFFEIGLGPWDIAAGALIIGEAGGVVSDFGGTGDYLQTGNIIAGNRIVHDRLLTQIKTVFVGVIDK